MKMTQPIGNGLYAPLFIRLALGAYLVMAGLAKLDNIPAFIKVIEEYKIISGHAATLYGVLVPYFEIGVGVMFIAGMWTTLAGIIASLILASFVYAMGIASKGGYVPNKDIILLAASLSLLYSGAGAFSVDRFRASGA